MDKVLDRIASALEGILQVLLVMSAKSVNPTLQAEPTADPLLDMPGSAKKPKKAKAVEQPPAVQAEPEEVQPEQQLPGKPVTLADVAEVVRKVVASDATNGHSKATTVLSSFGAKRISEVKEADFPKVIAKMNELLKAK